MAASSSVKHFSSQEIAEMIYVTTEKICYDRDKVAYSTSPELILEVLKSQVQNSIPEAKILRKIQTPLIYICCFPHIGAMRKNLYKSPPPDDWPQHVPYLDPNNNGKKQGEEDPAKCGTHKENLDATFFHLRDKFIEKVSDMGKKLNLDEKRRVQETQKELLAKLANCKPVSAARRKRNFSKEVQSQPLSCKIPKPSTELIGTDVEAATEMSEYFSSQSVSVTQVQPAYYLTAATLPTNGPSSTVVALPQNSSIVLPRLGMVQAQNVSQTTQNMATAYGRKSKTSASGKYSNPNQVQPGTGSSTTSDLTSFTYPTNHFASSVNHPSTPNPGITFTRGATSASMKTSGAASLINTYFGNMSQMTSNPVQSQDTTINSTMTASDVLGLFAPTPNLPTATVSKPVNNNMSQKATFALLSSSTLGTFSDSKFAVTSMLPYLSRRKHKTHKRPSPKARRNKISSSNSTVLTSETVGRQDVLHGRRILEVSGPAADCTNAKEEQVTKRNRTEVLETAVNILRDIPSPQPEDNPQSEDSYGEKERAEESSTEELIIDSNLDENVLENVCELPLTLSC